MDALDNVLKIFYYSLCDAAKWIFAIKMATGILKDIENFDLRNAITHLLHGGFAYGSLYSIVSILDAVKNQFR